jgi:hypothetical protein
VTFALSQTSALLLLFIVLPIVAAPLIVALVSWHGQTVPAGLRTSDLLRDGEPAEAELLGWKNRGLFLDRTPMVAFRLAVQPPGAPGADPIELAVTQSTPRPLLSGLSAGMTIEVRLSPDRTAAAIVWPVS